MSFQLDYPIAVLAHGGGYASIVEEHGAITRHSLIVLTDTDRSTDMLGRLGILGAPRVLHNAREFRWLVQSLREPVTHVAFDIDPVGAEPNPRETFSIAELLAEHLVVDYSPWNYPIYVVAVADAFASITAKREDGSPLHAIIVFRDKERAEGYIQLGGDGELCELDSLRAAVTFFTAMSQHVNAVALDPSFREGQWVTKYCFAMDVLLEKYLVEESGDANDRPV